MHIKNLTRLIEFYAYIKDNQPTTIRAVRRNFGFCHAYTHRILTKLRELGYVQYTGKQGATPAKFHITDKPFDLKKSEPPPPKVKVRKCAISKTPTKTFEIEIKPDPAAMWLLKSPPPSVKRSIPIVRSIGLGAKRDMY